MKKNCNGCRASEDDRCQFGYKIKQIRIESGRYVGLHLENKPLEECPKPKTLKDYDAQWRIHRGSDESDK